MRRENEFRYLKLAHILREQILSGFIKPGEYLMSENELCKHYEMSRTSVRKSLEQLLKEGLIVKKVGQGTIVSQDLVVEATQNKVLRIFATSPSHFFDICMPIIIEEFQKENPKVEVKCLSFSTGEFWESMNTSIDLGLHPDLVFISDRQYGEVEHTEQFVDLQDSFSDSPSLYPRLRDAFGSKAVPVTFSTVFLAYNPMLFRRHGVAEPTEQWKKEDFLQAARQLTMDTNGDGIHDNYGLSLSSSLNRWPVIALQNGVNFKAPDNTKPIVKTLEFLHDILYKHRVATLSPRYVLNSEAFLREKVAMVLTTSIEMSGWKNNAISFEPRVASLPFGDRKDTMLIANAFMIPKSGKETELALRFLQKAMHPDMQEKLSRAAGFISVLQPINEKVWSKSLLDSLHIHREAVENSYFLHEMFDDVSMVDELESEMMLYWSGMESAEEFAQRMHQILDKQ